MKDKFSPFNSPLQSIESLLEKSKKENIAYWLYENHLRDELFKLEALARIYESIYEGKFFNKLTNRTKALEDGLGQLDYYVEFRSNLSKLKSVPSEISLYINKKCEEHAESFLNMLESDKWLSGKRCKRIRTKLREKVTMNDEEETNKVESFLKNEIEEIHAFLEEINYAFTDPELHLHEIRRKVRWISIYAQALGGKVQLKKSTVLPAKYKKFATSSIRNSPFNTLPAPVNQVSILYMKQPAFWALSWMIKELGDLKDRCMYMAIAAELKQATGKALTKTQLLQLNIISETEEKALLKKAGKMCYDFIQTLALRELMLKRESSKEK